MKNTKISTVLNEIEGMNEDRVIDFLQNKYSDKPLLIKSILDILSINNSKANYFVYASLIKNHSLDLIKDFNPNEYINIVCGDWVIDSLICVTKKSAVFKASPADKSYDHKAAIKVLLPTFEFIASNNTSMQAHYISNLKHPNIVEGYGKGELKNGMSYVVMELLSNENIVEFCKSKKLKRDEICNLFLELCSGVSHMHISGCVHSDFNPNNVFMDVTGKPKIIDFDLSLTTNSAFHNNHSFNHVNGLTRKYAAPEHKKTNGIPTSLSDIYSLGCIFAEMLLGFQGVEKKEYSNLLDHKYKACWRTPELISIINKALENNPEDRYMSISSMAQDIQRFLTKKKIVFSYKKNASFFYKVRYFFNNNKMPLFFSGSLIIGSMVSLYHYINHEIESKESLNLLIESSLHYNNSNNLDVKANNVFNSNYIITQDYYNKLVSYGDIYTSRGQGAKALKFYEKASTLYSDKLSDYKINALTKLANTYFIIGERKQANEIILHYGNDIFNEKITSAYLIKMLMVALEINNNFLSDTLLSSFDDKFSAGSEIISNVKVSDFPVSMRKDIEVELTLSKVKSNYYSFAGDSSTILDNTTEVIYQNKIKPMLSACSIELKTLVDKLKLNDLFIKPELYLWLSRCESELGNNDIGNEYNEIGIVLTEKIYGFYHAKTIHAYLFKYSILRDKKPKEAARAALTAFNIRKGLERTEKSTDIFRFFSYQILFESYMRSGNFIESINIMDDALLTASKIENLSIIDKDILITMLTYFTDYLVYLYQPVKNKLTYDHYKVWFSKLIGDDISFFSFNNEISNEENLLLIEESYKYILSKSKINSLTAKEIYEQSKEFNLLALQSLVLECTHISGCDLEEQKKRLTFALKKMYWGDSKFISRTAKINYGLMTSYTWFMLKEKEKAQSALNDIEHLINISDSENTFTMMFNSLRYGFFKS